MSSSNNETICLNCRVKYARVRGNCWQCYERIRYLVRQGKVSWQQLESIGKCLPRKTTTETDYHNWRKKLSKSVKTSKDNKQ